MLWHQRHLVASTVCLETCKHPARQKTESAPSRSFRSKSGFSPRSATCTCASGSGDSPSHAPGGPTTASHAPRGPTTASHAPRGPTTASHVPRGPTTASHAPRGPTTASHAPRGPITASHAPRGPITSALGASSPPGLPSRDPSFLPGRMESHRHGEGQRQPEKEIGSGQESGASAARPSSTTHFPQIEPKERQRVLPGTGAAPAEPAPGKRRAEGTGRPEQAAQHQH
ncbi:hypothetical protein AB1E18_018794 [Capra hircus]